MTRRFVLAGHPVGHSISPAIHEAAYESLGVHDCHYEAVDCPDETAVRRIFDGLRDGSIQGVNVTVPHKRLALALADEVDESARAVGAANVLRTVGDGPDRRIVAHNTDVPALVDELLDLGGRPELACVMGSGGAALAAIAACQRIGARRVVVVARSFHPGQGPADWPRASSLIRLGAEPVPWSRSANGAWSNAVRAAGVIVQATSAGMKGADDGREVAEMACLGAARADAIAYDLVYNPPETPFLAAARAEGVRCRGGLGMLVGQAAHAVELWLGEKAPVRVMAQAAHRALFGEDSR